MQAIFIEVVYVNHNLVGYRSKFWELDFEKNVNKIEYVKLRGFYFIWGIVKDISLESC